VTLHLKVHNDGQGHPRLWVWVLVEIKRAARNVNLHVCNLLSMQDLEYKRLKIRDWNLADLKI